MTFLFLTVAFLTGAFVGFTLAAILCSAKDDS